MVNLGFGKLLIRLRRDFVNSFDLLFICPVNQYRKVEFFTRIVSPSVNPFPCSTNRSFFRCMFNSRENGQLMRSPILLCKKWLHISAGYGSIIRRDFFRRSSRYNLAAFFRSSRPKINDPVSVLDKVQIVLNHDHRMTD